nr:hypothetical protein [Tanacetum cinerariifolium]
MAPLTFADTHNMIAYLSKSDTSAGFDQVVDFLYAQFIQYALMVNPTIYVSCIKQLWATASIKKADNVVKLHDLIDRKKCKEDCVERIQLFNGVCCHLPCYRVGKGFSEVETPLFASMLVQPHPQATEEEDDVD